MKSDKNTKEEQVDEVKNVEEVEKVDEKDECKERIADLENQVKRTLADYQNLEKRVRDDRINWIKSANKDLLLRLLPILDTLMLASKHVQDQGLAVSIAQFLDVLKNEGAAKIKTTDTMFDPRLMECIQTVQGDEGKVIEEVRWGYTLNDTVIRPAQVKVGKKG